MKSLFTKLSILILGVSTLSACQTTEVDGPYFGTGIKIGEVTQTEAIVWVRLTKTAVRVGNDAPMPDVKYKDPKTGEMVERKGRPNVTPV
ncbi:MAG: hypothetical protein HOG79_00610, partial [Prolixibacteraceae bacterium]|nr:hypothetical protein [Prolixibacteraceae bacterium]